MVWIHLAPDVNQRRVLVIMAMNLQGNIKCWEILEYWGLLQKDTAPWG
jgi:hypothetical protein